MKLSELSKEEIKDILKELIVVVEGDKDQVEKFLRFRDIYIFDGKHCINYYNGYEHKACMINERSAQITSESIEGNKELTKIYKDILTSVLQDKYQLTM